MGREKRLDGEGTRYVFSIEVEKLCRIDEHRRAKGYPKGFSRAQFICQAIEEKLQRDS
jgi:hypothetical protein